VQHKKAKPVTAMNAHCAGHVVEIEMKMRPAAASTPNGIRQTLQDHAWIKKD
jgi:hypothetical protein